MITSAGNARVKQVVQWQNKAKERKKDGIFLAEGIKMFEEAPLDSIVDVYISERLEQKADAFYKKKLLQIGYEVVSDEVFAKMSDTQTPQGILTIL